TTINEEMKVAATHALAALAKEEVPDDVRAAYDGRKLEFGPDYIIPTPFDARVLYRVAPAVAKAAMDSGVARKPIEDFGLYVEQLERLLHPTREVLQRFFNQIRKGARQRIVFPEGSHESVLRACRIAADEGLAFPILLGSSDEIQRKIK
ncbi:MAG TPA: NADP-dependent malic enzyme, partial [Myxococcales bacterium]|nr:NADP-dependent malic enzyme [Myxococcales bacterium]